jgi:hypothetical protein
MSQRYEIALTQQEELNLRQLMVSPGVEALFKLLGGISFEAQADAMECKGNKETRLLKLTDAQSTRDVVNKLTRKLMSYRQLPEVEQPEEFDPLDFSTN